MKFSPNVWVQSGVFVLLALAVLTSCAVGSSSPVCLSGAYLDARGNCKAQSASEHYIPFREGSEIRVTQAFHGYASHREDLAFAVDFACDEGTPVTASRSGIVWAARDDSNRGCNDPECVDDANYVVIDHGDGTYSSYFHLQLKGALVEPGEQVCRGQVLGLCGNTGYSSGPHLHFSVMNTQWLTIPVRFPEGDERTGVVLPRGEYISQNKRQHQCKKTEYSGLGLDAFAHRGISLRREVPTVLNDESGRSMVFEGTYRGEMSHVAIHRRAVGTSDWIEQCIEVDEQGRFAFEVDWPTRVFSAGYYFMMLTGSDERCVAPGWAWSYRVRVD